MSNRVGVTPQQLADYLKVSRVAVLKAIQNGRISSEAAWQDEKQRWHIDPDRAAREYRETSTRDLPEPRGPLPEPKEPKKIPTVADSKARTETLKADMLELKYRQQLGELVPIADVRRVVAAEYSNVRQRLLGIPSRLAPRLVHETDPTKIHEAIEGAIVEALQELTADQADGTTHDDGSTDDGHE